MDRDSLRKDILKARDENGPGTREIEENDRMKLTLHYAQIYGLPKVTKAD